MKIASTCIYALNIPFAEEFSHNLSERNCSDSIVVKITTDSGVSGFGEGVPRPYVTGETPSSGIKHIKTRLLPRIAGMELNDVAPGGILAAVNSALDRPAADGAVIWNASRAAVELALIDCILRSRDLSLNTVLPPAVQTVTYSGIIGTGPLDRVEMNALRCKAMGFKFVKMKVSGTGDAERVAAVRRILGPAVSMRLDANAAFDSEAAAGFIKQVEKYDIACIEQPIPRGDPAELAALRRQSPIPLMADESIVTAEDARALITSNAVDYLNLRISKCGGLYNTLAIAKIAEASGIGIQLGCQVGETAILSAAGRHLAAHMKNVQFIEGSYGTLLLKEDISEDSITFGAAGSARLLTGAGLGIIVLEQILGKYADEQVVVC